MALWAKIESISLFTFFSFHSYSRCLYWTSLDTFQEFPDSLCPVSSQVLLGNDRITISGASQKQNMCIHYISTMRLYYVCLTNIFFFLHIFTVILFILFVCFCLVLLFEVVPVITEAFDSVNRLTPDSTLCPWHIVYMVSLQYSVLRTQLNRRCTVTRRASGFLCWANNFRNHCYKRIQDHW